MFIAKITMYGHCLSLKWDKTSHRFYMYQKKGIRNFEAKVEHEKFRLILQVGIHRLAGLVFFGQVPCSTADIGYITYTELGGFDLTYHTHLHLCEKRIN